MAWTRRKTQWTAVAVSFVAAGVVAWLGGPALAYAAIILPTLVGNIVQIHAPERDEQKWMWTVATIGLCGLLVAATFKANLDHERDVAAQNTKHDQEQKLHVETMEKLQRQITELTKLTQSVKTDNDRPINLAPVINNTIQVPTSSPAKATAFKLGTRNGIRISDGAPLDPDATTDATPIPYGATTAVVSVLPARLTFSGVPIMYEFSLLDAGHNVIGASPSYGNTQSPKLPPDARYVRCRNTSPGGNPITMVRYTFGLK